MTSVFCIQCESSLSETKAKDPGRKRCSVSSWIRALKEIALLSAWTYFPSYERHLTKYFPLITSQVLRWLCRHPWMFLFVSCRVKIQSLSRPRRFFCKGGKDQLTEFMWLSVECVSEPEKESKLLHSQAAGQTSTETLKNTSRPQEPRGLLGKKRLLT